jgi:MFS family permease
VSVRGRGHADRVRKPLPLLVALSACAGFGQFSAVASLGEVARAFGHPGPGSSIAAEAGLSGTELGAGLAILRLASVGGLLLSARADRSGRVVVLRRCAVVGLLATALAAASPGFWAFVALFALSRPFLSATSALAQVVTAESSESAGRSRAIAFVTGGYGLGSGLSAIAHSLFGAGQAFRVLFALCALPLLVVVPVGARLSEPERFRTAKGRTSASLSAASVLFRGGYRRRLLAVMWLSFAVAVMTGPVNSFFFLYAENVRHLSGGRVSLAVTLAGLSGLAGLAVGRRAADRLGRRVSVAAALLAMALGALATYSLGSLALLGGYVASVGAAGSLAPAAGSLVNELFPTEARATTAGCTLFASVIGALVGLIGFGVLADHFGSFPLATAGVAGICLASLPVLMGLPESLGRGLEELAPLG